MEEEKRRPSKSSPNPKVKPSSASRPLTPSEIAYLKETSKKIMQELREKY